MEEPISTIVFVLTLFIMVIGLIGIVLPVIPGILLILLAGFVYAVAEGFQAIGWPTLLVWVVLALIALSADIWASTVGAKMGGASGWSILFGLIGGLVGLVVFSLPGAILGAIAGVLLTEIARVGDWRQAFKAGGGWMLGWLMSTVFQLVIGLVMMAIFVWQVTQGV
jgi:uncharacterized protein YqgC (DUF456 family)